MGPRADWRPVEEDEGKEEVRYVKETEHGVEGKSHLKKKGQKRHYREDNSEKEH